MSTFESAVTKPRPPGRTLVLEPWVFADEWSKKPKSAVCVGLRLLADNEKTRARQTGEELADQVHPARGPNWIDAFNDAVIRQVAGLALCDPNDVKKPFELMLYPESDVSDALTSRGALHIFEQVDRYEIEASPIGVAAGVSELQRLQRLLEHADATALPMPLRRLIGVVVDGLDERYGDLVDAAGVDDAAEEVGFDVGVDEGDIGDALGSGEVDEEQAAAHIET